MNKSEQRGTGRSRARRAALIATGRKLFADTSYDALSMDDIARHAGVAKGLIYYYFKSKRGYYLAIVEDSVASFITLASSGADLPPEQRALRAVEGFLLFAKTHEASFRTIVTGGVGFDSEVMAIRQAVRQEMISTIAEGAYGRRDIPQIARTTLLGWMCSVEGVTLDWLSHQELPHETVGSLLVRALGDALRAIGELEPDWPAPTGPLPLRPPASVPAAAAPAGSTGPEAAQAGPVPAQAGPAPAAAPATAVTPGAPAPARTAAVRLPEGS
ncbi:TetR family transcriptional regulator [Streptomyces sp. GC420]|nr:TetR family transcriptional regulator [Streptomyces sp. GC420]